MFNHAFKSLLRILKEDGFPYKCRLYGNSQFATNCYTVVLYYRMFKYSLRKKSALLLLGLASMTFLRDTLVWATAYWSLKIVSILANSAGPDGMPFLRHFIWVLTVCQSFQYTKG